MKDNKIIHLWKGINWLPEKYRNLTGKSILVINDIQNAIKLSLNNKVVFLTADEKCSNQYKTMIIGNEAFGKDDVLEVINEWKIDKVNTVLDKYDMFDIAVMNPPYDKNLHLKILEAVIPHAEKVVNISPIRWLQDPLAKYKHVYDKYSLIVSNLYELDVIPMDTAEQMFNAHFNMNLGIYKIQHEKCAKTFDVSMFSNNILDKVIANMPDNFEKHVMYSKPMKNSLVLSMITGGNNGRTNQFCVWCDDLKRYCYIDNRNAAGQTYYEYRKSVCWGNVKPKEECTHVEFETMNELQNFFNSINTKFFLYLFNKHTVDVNVHGDFLPFMNDYAQPWTDQRFYEFFRLTPEEIKTIEEYVR